MNQNQCEQVEKLRKQGVGFAVIAERLGLSKNTVKSYCRRKALCLPEPAQEKEGVCPQCGKSLIQKKSGKPRRFCSDACRYAWWNAHRLPPRIESLETNTCAACGKIFRSYPSAGRKYCSRGCYINFRYGEAADDEQRAI